ncbi:hypothetical protein [Streptosporangium sp. KLBMP 9127]|nr:hypothetical protein [Streptosporangium sp. KLBMP 9127]
MSNVLIRRGPAVIAASVLVLLTASCGLASANTEACLEATAVWNDLGDKLAKANDNFDGLDKALDEAAGKLKTIGGKAEGELATELAKMADDIDSVKLDGSDPAAAVGELEKLTKIFSEGGAKVANAC